MPSKVRIVTRKSKKEIDLDRVSQRVLQQLCDESRHGEEVEHFGIADQETADELRKSYRRSGRKTTPEAVSVKAFWKECPTGCERGGPDCRYHVYFSVHNMAEARAYMERKAKYAARR